MKQSLRERFIWWLCDTFGHKKTDARRGNIEWHHAGLYHYHCLRCERIVSKAPAQGSADRAALAAGSKDSKGGAND